MILFANKRSNKPNWEGEKLTNTLQFEMMFTQNWLTKFSNYYIKMK